MKWELHPQWKFEFFLILKAAGHYTKFKIAHFLKKGRFLIRTFYSNSPVLTADDASRIWISKRSWNGLRRERWNRTWLARYRTMNVCRKDIVRREGGYIAPPTALSKLHPSQEASRKWQHWVEDTRVFSRVYRQNLHPFFYRELILSCSLEENRNNYVLVSN